MEEEDDSPPADRTFQMTKVCTAPFSHQCEAVTLSCVPHPNSCALPTEMDSVGLAIMRQIKKERDV